jgi:hypothetical protein
MKNVPAHGIADFHFYVGAGKFACIAGMLKMVEQRFGEHVSLSGRKVFFVNGSDDDVIGVDHFGEMEFTNFGEEFVGVQFR